MALLAAAATRKDKHTEATLRCPLWVRDGKLRPIQTMGWYSALKTDELSGHEKIQRNPHAHNYMEPSCT